MSHMRMETKCIQTDKYTVWTTITIIQQYNLKPYYTLLNNNDNVNNNEKVNNIKWDWIIKLICNEWLKYHTILAIWCVHQYLNSIWNTNWFFNNKMEFELLHI